MRYPAAALLAMMLSGCSTLYSPTPEGYTGETATIKDSYSDLNNMSAHYFMLSQVDDKKVDDSWLKTRAENYGKGFVFSPGIVSRTVLPVEQKLTLQGMVYFPTDVQAIFGDEMRVTRDFVFTPKAGEVYEVKGRLEKTGSSVWLEDSSGKVVDGSLGKER